MRKLLVAGLALALLVLFPAANASHVTSTGSLNYIISAGARVNHGITGVIPDDRNGVATTNCSPFLINNFGGCIGGGVIYPSNYDPTAPVNFYRMAMTVTDVVSGPNVYASVCNYHPLSPTWCDNAVLDEGQDAFMVACGVTLVADAEGIPGHIGDSAAVAFTHNLWVDPATTEVCVGTSGSLSVVFDKSNDA